MLTTQESISLLENKLCVYLAIVPRSVVHVFFTSYYCWRQHCRNFLNSFHWTFTALNLTAFHASIRNGFAPKEFDAIYGYYKYLNYSISFREPFPPKLKNSYILDHSPWEIHDVSFLFLKILLFFDREEGEGGCTNYATRPTFVIVSFFLQPFRILSV